MRSAIELVEKWYEEAHAAIPRSELERLAKMIEEALAPASPKGDSDA